MLKNRFFYFLFSLLMTLFIVPVCFRDGMFMDGVIYATIARNISINTGSFWDLFYFCEFPFREHPPLAFGIQSLFFWIFGDHLIIERIYSVLTGVISAVLINGIWKKVAPEKFCNYGWVPLMLWIFIPLNSWTFSNNMLENTLLVFTLSAVYAFIYPTQAIGKGSIIYIALFCFSIIGAFMTKGPVGLFPLGLPFLNFIFRIDYKFKNLLKDYIIITILTVLILLTIIWLNPTGIKFFKEYFEIQVMRSLRGELVVVNRWFSLQKLIMELIPILIITAGFIYFFRRILFNWIKVPVTKNTIGLFFSVGLSAIVPMMVSPKQLPFYIVPGLPYFALGFGFLIVPAVHSILNEWKISEKFLTRGNYIFFLTSILVVLTTLYFFDQPSRNKEKLKIVDEVSKRTGPGKMMFVCSHISGDYGLHAYFQRKHQIVFCSNYNNMQPFALHEVGCTGVQPGEELVEKFEKVELYKFN